MLAPKKGDDEMKKFMLLGGLAVAGVLMVCGLYLFSKRHELEEYCFEDEDENDYDPLAYDDPSIFAED